MTGQVLGSPSYMPPEQATGRNCELQPACDVYALGAILYELLTGRPPFQGESPQAVIEQVKANDPAPPRRLNASVPPDLETICLKCLEKLPSQRYTTAEALADDLERFVRGEPVRARPVGALGRTARWARRRPAVAALLGVCAMLFAAIVLVMAFGSMRIRASRDDARARLMDSLISEAHALRIAGAPGHRLAALDRISQAAELDSHGRHRLRLRKEAIAAFAKADASRVTATNLPLTHDPMLMAFDRTFEVCALRAVESRGIGIYGVSDGKRRHYLPLPKDPDEIREFSADGRFLSFRYQDKMVVYHVPDGREVLGFGEGEGLGGPSGAFSRDGRLFARSESGLRLVTYELESGNNPSARKVREWPLPTSAKLLTLAWSPAGDALALLCDAGRLQVCDAESGHLRWQREFPSGAVHVAWDEARDLISVQTGTDAVELLRGQDGTGLRQVHSAGDASSTSLLAEGSLLLVCASESLGTRFYDAPSGRPLLSEPIGSWHLRYDPARRRFARCSMKATPLGWSGCLHPFSIHYAETIQIPRERSRISVTTVAGLRSSREMASCFGM